MANHPLDPVFQALADPTRRAVLARLVQGPASVSDLAAPFDMALPSFLQHLRVLERAALIRTEKSGRTRTCHLNPGRLAAAEGWMAERRAEWEARLSRLDQAIKEIRDDDPD